MYDRLLSEAENHTILKNEFASAALKEIKVLIDLSSKNLEHESANVLCTKLTVIQKQLESNEFDIGIISSLNTIRSEFVKAIKQLEDKKIEKEYSELRPEVDNILKKRGIIKTSEARSFSYEEQAIVGKKRLEARLENPLTKPEFLPGIQSDLEKINRFLQVANIHNKTALTIGAANNATYQTSQTAQKLIVAVNKLRTFGQIQDDPDLSKTQKATFARLLGKTLRKLTEKIANDIGEIHKRLERTIIMDLEEAKDAEVVTTAKEIQLTIVRIENALRSEIENVLKKSDPVMDEKPYKDLTTSIPKLLEDLSEKMTNLEIRIGQKSSEALATGNPVAKRNELNFDLPGVVSKNKDEDTFKPIMP